MNSALKMSQVVVISILLAGCFASAQSASFSVLNSIGQGSLFQVFIELGLCILYVRFFSRFQWVINVIIV